MSNKNRSRSRQNKNKNKSQSQQNLIERLAKLPKSELIRLIEEKDAALNKASETRRVRREKVTRESAETVSAALPSADTVSAWRDYAATETETPIESALALCCAAAAIRHDIPLATSTVIRCAVPVLIERRAIAFALSSSDIASDTDERWSRFTSRIGHDVQRILSALCIFEPSQPKTGHVCKATRVALQHGIDYGDDAAIVAAIGKQGWFSGHTPCVEPHTVSLVETVCELVGL